jgi:hypothetical protein
MREGAQQQLDELEKRIGAMRGALNSMSPADRRSQASIILDPQQTEITGLAKPGTPGASPLVRINPDLFESRHIAHRIQVLDHHPKSRTRPR